MMSIALLIIISVLSIVGARLGNVPILIGMLCLVCLSIILICLNLIHKKYYPYLVLSISCALIYQITLYSNYLVGTDLHGEFFRSYLTLTSGFQLDRIDVHTPALSISVLAPLLTKLGIDLYWVYKVVLPLFFIVSPFILYYIYKSQFTEKESFLACFFYMSIPTFLVEIPGIEKQMVGEFFLIATFFFMVVKIDIVLVLLLSLLTVISHYSMGIILIYYLCTYIPFSLILRYFGGHSLVPLKSFIPILLVIILVSGTFFTFIGGGWVTKSVVGVGTSVLQGTPMDKFGGTDIKVYPSGGKIEPILRAGLGLDLLDPQISLLGKIFRVWQLLTELLLLIGGILFLFRWKKFSVEYIAFIIGGIFLLGVIVLVPGVSPVINATRFYNIALIFLSPLFIIGGLKLLKQPILLTILILLPYFFFTSGIAYELSGSQVMDKPNLPIAPSLSCPRIDYTGVYTDNDVKVRDWIGTQENTRFILGDIWGASLLSEKMGPRMSYWDYIPSDLSQVKNSDYIYLRERNTQTQTFTFWLGVGLRESKSWKSLNWAKVVKGREIIYQVGDSIIYGSKY